MSPMDGLLKTLAKKLEKISKNFMHNLKGSNYVKCFNQTLTW